MELGILAPMKLLSLRCDGLTEKYLAKGVSDRPDKRNDVPHESDNDRTCINLAYGMGNRSKCRLVVDHDSCF